MTQSPHSPAQTSHSSFRQAPGSPQPPQTLALAHTASPSVSLRQRALLSQPQPESTQQINGIGAVGDSPLRRNQAGGGGAGPIPGVARLQDSPRLMKENSAHSSPSLKSANGQGSA